MRARMVVAVLAAAVVAVGPAAAAQADVVPGPAIAVTGDEDGDVVVDVSEVDGTWSGSLVVTNASDAVVELAVAARPGWTRTARRRRCRRTRSRRTGCSR